MTSKERVMKALNFETVDRIPRYDNYSKEFSAACRKAFNLSSNASITDYFDIDVSIICPDETILPSRERTISDNGLERLYMNGWGSTIIEKKDKYFYTEVDHLIKSQEDLDSITFDDPTADSRYVSFEKHVNADKEKGLGVFGKIGGPYIRSNLIMGAEDYLYTLAAEPEFAKALAERVTDHLLEIAKQELIRGNLYDTGIWIFDDMGYNDGPMMSPKCFEEIFYPCYKKLVSGIKSAGAAKVVLHSDGNIEPLLDMLVDAGIEALNPVEPRAKMSISKLQKKYGKKLAYIGGMCNSVVLVGGTKDDIVRQTNEILEASKDRGVIIGAHSIGADISVENYLTYIATIEKFNHIKGKKENGK